MDHERATALISDLAQGRLDPGLAAEVERHVRDCPECRGVWEAASGIRAQVESRGAGFLAPHPTGEEVAAYAVFPDHLPQSQLAAVGLHVRACPICEAEVATARRSLRHAWWRGWRSELLGVDPNPIRALAGPALAVLALALLYPAYLGTFRYPAALRERDRLASAADSLRESGSAPRIEPGESARPGAREEGAVGSIVLTGPSRGAGFPVPVLHRRAGQRFVHVLIDHPVAAEARAAHRRIEVSILRLGEAAPIWSFDGDAASLWDEGLQAAGFVIPASRLEPGAYRLEFTPGAGAPGFVAEFRVEPGAP
ncbi:MAG TPA: zf-HC2 domain-containing protein [Candidatus Eisenbacteria bacterium]|jgi:hypothetical protein